MRRLSPLFALLLSSASVCSAFVVDSTRVDTIPTRPTVVVTASRVPLELSNVARTVDVMHAHDLQRLPVRSIQDALVFVPGVDLRTRGPYGAQSDVSIRGGSYEQTTMLLNGMRLTDPQTGHHQLNLPLAPLDIDRIEVVKGGASRLFGPGAMDGVVNIIPRIPTASSSTGSVIGGDFGYLEGRASAALLTGDVHNVLSGQYVKHNGYRQSTDLKLGSAFLSGGLTTAETTVNWLGGIVDKSFGAGLFYSPRFPDAWEHTLTWLAGLRVATPLSEIWTMSVAGLYRTNTDEFLLKRDDPAFYRNTHTTHSATVTALVTGTYSFATLTLGAEGGADNIVSSNLGDHDRVRGGVSAEIRAPLTSDVFATVGANITGFSDRTPGVGYGADLQWRPTVDLRVFATVNRSFRIPTYTELYYKDPTTRGNAALLPEHAITAELGGSVLVENIEFRASGFIRNGRDLIDYVLDTGNIYVAENIESVDIQGIEGVVTIPVQRLWNASPLTMLQWTVNFASVESTANAQTRYTRDQLRWQSIIRADVTMPLDVLCTFTVRIVERYTDGVMRSIGDLRLQRAFGGVRILAEASNLWNTSMIEAGWVPIAPRWFRAGIEASIY
ncbi:MAG: TonB-dependent receptor [Ignavibacteria bacterium]|nr:TonB-dependent receptor [Ignavibacteria bacterium]MBK6420050.1 TonB-dependent receptor [Ignavibacteria bacterium]MBK7413011.1 TonB-dependent receptor [Ignavibacteria bacterium]MBL0321494.1 TonB-dependent receptor [Ignavibacteria bacterium]